MPTFLQNLDQRFPIVDPRTGQPTDYFMRLLQGQNGTLADGVTSVEDAVATLEARNINTGFGLSGGGNLSADRTLALGNPALADPGADRGLFWDDSAGQLDWLTYGSGLSLSGTTLTATGGGAFSGAMVRKSVDQTGANYSTATAITWDSEIYDTDGFHDNVTNNTRLTVQADGYVQVGGTVTAGSVSSGAEYQLIVTKGGATAYDGVVRQAAEMPSTTLPALVSVCSGPIAVTAGEYFELQYRLTTDTSIDILAASSNFWLRVVG